jgi:hypothetical protein
MISLWVSESVAAEARRRAQQLGVDRSEPLSDALWPSPRQPDTLLCGDKLAVCVA